MAGCYAVAGHSFCIATDDEKVARLISRALNDYQFDLKDAESECDPAYPIRVSDEDPPPSIPKGLETFEVPFGHCHTDGEKYYFAIKDSVMIAEPGGGLKVWVGRTHAARQPEALVSLILYAVETSLRRAGLYQLHGGGVLEPKGR